MSNDEKILAVLEEHGKLLVGLTETVGRLGTGVTGLKEDVAGLKEGQAKLEASVAGLKEGQTKLEASVAGLKKEVADVKTDVAGIKLRLENEFTQKFNLLAEGQQTILDTLATKRSAEELREEQQALKQVVALHSLEIAELKKAE